MKHWYYTFGPHRAEVIHARAKIHQLIGGRTWSILFLRKIQQVES